MGNLKKKVYISENLGAGFWVKRLLFKLDTVIGICLAAVPYKSSKVSISPIFNLSDDAFTEKPNIEKERRKFFPQWR